MNNVNQEQLIDKLLNLVLLLEDVTLIVKQQIQLMNVLNAKKDIQKYKLQDIDPQINLFVRNQLSFHIAKNITQMVHAMNVSITCHKIKTFKMQLPQK